MAGDAHLSLEQHWRVTINMYSARLVCRLCYLCFTLLVDNLGLRQCPQLHLRLVQGCLRNMDFDPVPKHRKLCCVCWFSNKLLCILLYTALSIMQSPFEICPQYSLWTLTIQDEIHACFYRAKFSLHSLRCTRLPMHLSCRYTWTSNHHAIHHATLALIIPTSHITASIFLLCTHT